jgi:hypothetical protein
MAITSKLIRILCDGGKTTDDLMHVADAMDRMSDAYEVFTLVDAMRGQKDSAIAAAVCDLATQILAGRESELQSRGYNPNEPRFYVYHHVGMTTGMVFYVGKGCGDRYADRRKRTKAWKEHVKQEGGYRAYIIRDGMTESEALQFELDEIAFHAPQNDLVNVRGLPN